MTATISLTLTKRCGSVGCGRPPLRAFSGRAGCGDGLADSANFAEKRTSYLKNTEFMVHFQEKMEKKTPYGTRCETNTDWSAPR